MNAAAIEEKRYRFMLELDLGGISALESLVQGLYDESWRVRSAAAEQLARIPDRHRAVPRLLAALADRGHTGARNSAAEALIRLGTAAAPAAISLMGHPDPDQRRFAADILGGMRLSEATTVLIAGLRDSDHNVRISAAEALGRIGGETATAALKGLLDEADPLLRLCALEGLAELRSPPSLSQLVPLLRDARARRSAYRLMGMIPDPSAAELICGGLSSTARSVREAAVAAVAAQRSLLPPNRQSQLEGLVRGALEASDETRAFLQGALTAGDSEVRAGALFIAGLLREAKLAPVIAEAARDERLAEDAVRTLCSLGAAAAGELLRHFDLLSGPARVAAAQALAQLADPSHVRDLTRLADSAEPEVQLWAVKALGQCKAIEAIEPLVRMLCDDQLASAAGKALVCVAQRFEWQVLERLEEAIASQATGAAVWVLGRVGKARSLPTLLRTVRDSDPHVRTASVEAAGELGVETALELARIGLGDPDPAVRCAAARILGAFSPTGSEPLLRRALGDSDAWVQAAAIESAGENDATQLAPELEQLAGSIDGLRAARAIRALARMKRLSTHLWQSALRHRDPEVVKEALLASQAGPESASSAVDLLSHSRWDVRAAAARVLASSGRADCLPPLKSALEREPDALAREALLEACDALSA